MLTRRTLLKGLAVTAAGLLIPAEVLAEPERRVWALDSTQMGFTDLADTPVSPITRGSLVFGPDILRYDRLFPRTDHEIIRVNRLYPDGRIEFVRWEGSSFWPVNG